MAVHNRFLLQASCPLCFKFHSAPFCCGSMLSATALLSGTSTPLPFLSVVLPLITHEVEPVSWSHKLSSLESAVRTKQTRGGIHPHSLYLSYLAVLLFPSTPVVHRPDLGSQLPALEVHLSAVHRCPWSARPPSFPMHGSDSQGREHLRLPERHPLQPIKRPTPGLTISHPIAIKTLSDCTQCKIRWMVSFE